MKKKIGILVLILIIILLGTYIAYKKLYNPNPSEKEIIRGVEEKNKIRNELSNLIQGSNDENYQISIEEARQKAITIFNSLGEYNLNKDNVKVREINKNEKKYYYITSLENSAEVEISTGKVTKINNVSQ